MTSVQKVQSHRMSKELIRAMATIIVAMLFVPSGLLIINAIRNGTGVFSGGLGIFIMNWGFMATPFILYLAIQSMEIGRELTSLVVGVLSLELIAFQCWIWWCVPGKESALAWILYIPLWIILLGGLLLMSWIRMRHRHTV